MLTSRKPHGHQDPSPTAAERFNPGNPAGGDTLTRDYTPQDLAELFRCEVEHVLDLRRAGLLRGYSISKPGSKRPRWRFTADAVAAYRAGETPSAAVVPARRQRRKPQGIIEFYK